MSEVETFLRIIHDPPELPVEVAHLLGKQGITDLLGAGPHSLVREGVLLFGVEMMGSSGRPIPVRTSHGDRGRARAKVGPVKILISADMEGATGVTWPADCEPGTEQWQRCRSMFTSDVNATIEGLFDGGASEVFVNEAHATMRNLLLEHLDERATMITGRHKELSMVEGVQSGDVDGIVFLGYHCGAGEEGVLAHTYLPNAFTGVWLDGATASEGYLNAAVVAEFGTPVVLVTGDDRACEDADSYAPSARKVAVKDHVSRYAARCRPPARTAVAIRAAAKSSMELAGAVEPAAPRSTVLEVEVDSAHLAQAAAIVPGVERTDVRRVRYTAPDAYEMIRCFKAIATLVSQAMESQYG